MISRTAPLLAALGLSLAAAPAASAKTTLTLNGSTSVYPLAVQLAKSYNKSNDDTSFRILQGGSDVGIKDVSRGRVTFGMASRDLQASSDPGGLKAYKIARDGVCIATNPGNALGNLSVKTVQQIFSGQIRNWSAVPGAKATGPIDLVTRTAASGTADAFQNIFMGQTLRVAGNASQKASNGLVQQTLASNKNAIAYVDFKFTAGTSPAPIDGVPCNLANAKSGQYRGVRNFWLIARGAPSGEAKKFLKFVRGSAGQKIVAKGWVTYK